MTQARTKCKAVLIIEDDHDMRESFEMAVRSLGIEAFAAEDGYSAFVSIPNVPKPCLILLDLMMQGMDGWEFVKRKRECRELADCPIIVISAYSKEIGFPRDDIADVIRKPVQLEELLQMVQLYF